MAIVRSSVGLFLLVLVVTGVAGTVYKITSPEGWIAHAFGRSFSAGFAALGSLAAVMALAWFSRGWAIRSRNHYADLFVYSFAAAGFLYLWHFWLKGSF
ncbi:MAG TPA: hypothetical protein VIV54_08640 [Burkholderiales bacterium]